MAYQRRRTERTGDGYFSSPSGMSFEKVAEAFGNERNATINDPLKQHLMKVYGTLGWGCGVAAVGVYVYMLTHVSYWLPLLVSVASIMLLASSDHARVPLRLGYFSLICLCQGITLGGLVELALHVDASLVGVALLATLVVFLGFTMAALFSKKRSMLVLGGFLYSSVGYMSLMSLMNIFFRSQILWNVNLYGGLLVFSGYIAFDTFLMIEKFYQGNEDFVSHALELFLDLASVFARILIILLKNQEDSDKRRRRQR